MQKTSPITFDITKFAGLVTADITTEGLDVVTKIPKFFSDRLGSVVDFFSASDAELKEYSTAEANVYFKELINSRNAMSKAGDSLDYRTISRRRTPTIIGLDTDVLTLARLLTESNAIVMKHTDTLLTETSEVIAKLASDKEYRLSSRPVTINPEYTKAIEKLDTNLVDVFDQRKVADHAKIGVVMPSVPHLTEAIALGLEYGSTHRVDIFHSIEGRVNQISSYSESLLDVFKADKTNITKKRIMEVSVYLSTAAKFITAATNTLYMSNQSIILMNNMTKVITK